METDALGLKEEGREDEITTEEDEDNGTVEEVERALEDEEALKGVEVLEEEEVEEEKEALEEEEEALEEEEEVLEEEVEEDVEELWLEGGRREAVQESARTD